MCRFGMERFHGDRNSYLTTCGGVRAWFGCVAAGPSLESVVAPRRKFSLASGAVDIPTG